MFGTTRGTQFGYSLWEFGVFAGARGTCGTTNVALGRPTTTSSLENSTFPAANATDGNTGTRWSSAFSDPQWLEVDLGSTQFDLPGQPGLGGRLRDRVPDPGLQ